MQVTGSSGYFSWPPCSVCGTGNVLVGVRGQSESVRPDNSEKEDAFKNEVRQEILSQTTKEFP
jgi:hypothetical protein